MGLIEQLTDCMAKFNLVVEKIKILGLVILIVRKIVNHGHMVNNLVSIPQVALF